MESLESQIQAKVIEMRAARQDMREQIAEAGKAVAESRARREGSALRLAQTAEPPAPLPRPRNYTEWKAQKAAREAAGGSINLATVGADGKPVKDVTPLWADYVQREREAGRLPERSIIEIARGRGTPIRDMADYRRVKLELEGGDAA